MQLAGGMPRSALRTSASRRTIRQWKRTKVPSLRCKASPATSVLVVRQVVKQSVVCALAESATLVRLAFAREAVCRTSSTQAGLFAAASTVATLLYHSLVFYGTEERLGVVERRHKAVGSGWEGAEQPPEQCTSATEADKGQQQDSRCWKERKQSIELNGNTARTKHTIWVLAAGLAWWCLPMGLSILGLVAFAGGSALLRGRLLAEMEHETVARIACATFGIQSALIFLMQCSGQLMNDRWISTSVVVAACTEFIWLWNEQPMDTEQKILSPDDFQRVGGAQESEAGIEHQRLVKQQPREAPLERSLPQMKELWHRLVRPKTRWYPLQRCAQFFLRSILLVEVSSFLISYVAHLDIPNIQAHQMLQPLLSVQAVLALGFLRASHAAFARLRACSASASAQLAAFKSWLLSSVLLTMVISFVCAVVSLRGPELAKISPLLSLIMLLPTSHSVLEGCVIAQGNLMNALVPLAGSTGMMIAFTVLRGEAHQDFATFQIAFAIFHSHLWLRFWLHCKDWQQQVNR
mmetsp:Transcript_5280/g.33156  ORF Transcript_5280/g.33156 Transcript_5280/m.33156 type:complete len:522 (-) Transcript_5280:798-2363(-)